MKINLSLSAHTSSASAYLLHLPFFPGPFLPFDCDGSFLLLRVRNLIMIIGSSCSLLL